MDKSTPMFWPPILFAQVTVYTTPSTPLRAHAVAYASHEGEVLITTTITSPCPTTAAKRAVLLLQRSLKEHHPNFTLPATFLGETDLPF